MTRSRQRSSGLAWNQHHKTWFFRQVESGWRRVTASQFNHSKLIREDIAKLDFELIQDGCEIINAQFLMASFDPVQCRMRQPNLLGKLHIRHASTPFSQEFSKGTIQIPPHLPSLTKEP
jgi:hypothetical protein